MEGPVQSTAYTFTAPDRYWLIDETLSRRESYPFLPIVLGGVNFVGRYWTGTLHLRRGFRRAWDQW